MQPNQSKLLLPDLAVGSSQIFPTTPAQVAYNPSVAGLAFGAPVDLISGNIGIQLLTGIPAPPTSITGNAQSITTFTLASDYASYSSAFAVDAAATGNYGAVNGSFTGSFFEGVNATDMSVVVSANGFAVNGAWIPSTTGAPNTWNIADVTVNTDIQSQIVNNGYTSFINEYGTHFVGGLLYGTQYNAAITATFANASSQVAAAASLSASFTGIVASADFSAALTTTMSSASGFTSLEWSQVAAGGFTPVALGTSVTSNIANINQNLTTYISETGGPIYFLLYDWRIIPWIATAASQSPPSFSFASYLANLAEVQEAMSITAYFVATADSLLINKQYFGATNENTLQNLIIDGYQNENSLQQMYPQDTAEFSITEYWAGAGNNVWSNGFSLENISNGMVNVQISATMDSSFNISSAGPAIFQILPGPGYYGFNATKPNEMWIFGCYCQTAGTIIPCQGLLQNGILYINQLCNNAAPITCPSPPVLTSTPVTISGVENNNAWMYNWLTTTLSFV